MQLVGQTMSLEKILANITMLPLMFNQEMILGLYWTLEVELIFYLLGLLLFLVGVSQKPIYIFATSVFFLILFVVLRILHFENEEHIGLIVMPLHLSIMFWGALFRYFYDNPIMEVKFLNRQISIKILFVLLTLLILSIPIASLVKGLILENFKYIQLGIAYVSGILIFLIFSMVYKIKNRFLIWIGTISYSMYLFHPIVFYTVFWWLQTYAPVELKEMHLSVYLIINFILSILVSSIVYYLIEKPSIKLSHYLTSYAPKNEKHSY
jgi:peptidoglycan/LPS O-acetylase OafA/YrhL